MTSVAMIAMAALLAGCAADVSDADAPDPGETTAASLKHEPGSLTIATIGDSIMAGYGVDPDEAWPSLLGEATGDTVVNLACSGAGFVVVGDCDTDYAGLIAEAKAVDPDVVIVQSSDNDVFESRSDILDDTEATIAALHEAVPDARIIGINTLWHLPWEEPRAIGWSTDALRTALSGDDDTFVWIGQPLQGDAHLLQWDEEHPTVEGQQAIFDAVATAFSKAGIQL